MDVFEKLKPIYVEDDKFERDFAVLSLDTGTRRKKLAKYMLTRFEQDASGHACDPDTDPATIEHILPENPLDDWTDSFPPEHWEGAVYRLGNLTLLEAAANRQIGNAAYPDKRDAYLKSTYAVTRRIPEIAPDQWTADLLDGRQSSLAKRAVHLWRSDYA